MCSPCYHFSLPRVFSLHFHKCAKYHIQTTVTLYQVWLFLMIVPCKFSQDRLFPASPFLFLNVLFCTTDSRNLLDLEWQIGIWLCSVLCTWLLLPYFWSNLISRTDWKIRQSLPLLSVSLIPMGHNFIFSQHCFVSHPWLLPPNTLGVSSLLIIKSFSNPFPYFKSFPLVEVVFFHLSHLTIKLLSHLLFQKRST